MHVDFFHSLDAAKLSMKMIMLAESSKINHDLLPKQGLTLIYSNTI